MRMLGFLAVLLLFGSGVSVVQGADDGWLVYENERFGTAIDIPAFALNALPAPQNGDGQGWVSKDTSVSLTAYGSYWSVTVESWDDYRVQFRRWLLEEKAILLYAPVGDDWFVLSGKVNNNLVYVRVNRSSRCPDIAHHVRIEYPASEKEARDAWVIRISKSMGEVPAAACP